MYTIVLKSGFEFEVSQEDWYKMSKHFRLNVPVPKELSDGSLIRPLDIMAMFPDANLEPYIAPPKEPIEPVIEPDKDLPPAKNLTQAKAERKKRVDAENKAAEKRYEDATKEGK